MGRPLIAGNWKMHGLAGSLDELRQIAARAARVRQPDILVCPPATLLARARDLLGAESAVALGGQDCHAAETGAHTGDISAEMLRDAGATYAIVGHSERRADHGESDAQVRAKAQAAQRAGLVPIVCIGETLAERDAGRTLEVVARQLAGSLPDSVRAETLVVAYEPVWAIGTGRTPTTEDVRAVHGLIRQRLGAPGVRILYGGSVKPANARELMAVPDVDGALVGGASLTAADFWPIVEAKAS